MSYWVYKCNSQYGPHQKHYGDWVDVFERPLRGGVRRWGTSEVVPKLAELEPGDTIIAYQTDRNELVGVATVVEMKGRGDYRDVVLKPVEQIGVKVRPLKQRFAKIAKLTAFQQGVIKTVYDISPQDAEFLLKKARAAKNDE